MSARPPFMPGHGEDARLHRKIVPEHVKGKLGRIFSDEEHQQIMQFLKEFFENEKNFKNLHIDNTEGIKIHRTRIKDPKYGTPKVGEERGPLRLNNGTIFNLRYSILLIPDLKDLSKLTPYILYEGKERTTLGAGGAGKVDLGQNLLTGEWVAIKKQTIKSAISEEDLKRQADKLKETTLAESEAEVDVETGQGFTHRDATKRNIQEGHVMQWKSYIITKLGFGEDLFDYYGKIEESGETVPYLEALDTAISAVKDLDTRFHKKNIIHRDLKPDNIMIDPETHSARIIDLGMQINLNKALAHAKKNIGVYRVMKVLDNKMKETGEYIFYEPNARGTKEYVAPEIIATRGYSKKSDIYAMGVTFRRNIFRPTWLWGPKSEINNLINSMTEKNPNLRPDTKTIIETLGGIRERYLRDNDLKEDEEMYAIEPEREIDNFFEKLREVILGYDLVLQEKHDIEQFNIYKSLNLALNLYQSHHLSYGTLKKIAQQVGHYINRNQDDLWFENKDRFNTDLVLFWLYFDKLDQKFIEVLKKGQVVQPSPKEPQGEPPLPERARPATYKALKTIPPDPAMAFRGLEEANAQANAQRELDKTKEHEAPESKPKKQLKRKKT